MYKHWNETGHRFGLFSEGGAVRPQYFVYQLLSRMGDEKVATTCAAADLHVQALRGTGKLAALIVNYDPAQSRDLVVTVNFANLQPGVRKLRGRRIDDDQRWVKETMESIPIEDARSQSCPNFSINSMYQRTAYCWSRWRNDMNTTLPKTLGDGLTLRAVSSPTDVQRYIDLSVA